MVFSVPLNTSRGVELVNASALFLLLLLNLILIGRQDRLKRQEVERRLRGIIDQIQGEAEGQISLEEGCPVTCQSSFRLSPLGVRGWSCLLSRMGRSEGHRIAVYQSMVESNGGTGRLVEYPVLGERAVERFGFFPPSVLSSGTGPEE